MGTGTVVLIVVLVLAVVAVLFVVGLYNGLVQLRNRVKNAWSQIDVQLKRRHDLIPNLVETVKGYASHESKVLEEVTKARSRAVDARGVDKQAAAESELSGALGRLMLVVEQYPDLKANQNFLALQEELTSTENKISFSRQFYNDSVMQYNTRIESVPSNIIANMFNFKQESFFEIQDKQEREAPKVQF
jgi:LemA protein